MTKTLLSGMIAFPALLCPISASASDPVAPGNLEAEVNGMVVGLTWEWGNAGECILAEDFEGDIFPAPNWEVRNTYSLDEFGNWQLYNFEDEPGVMLSHSGFQTATLMMGTDDPDEPSLSHQDEWLIVRPGVGAAYMEFWYFLHPELLEVGGFRDFPDHYYVNISYDNGESWEELWDGRWDMGAYEGVQQASLFLGDETDEDTLVAFHAVSGEEESLYFLWCVDDVEFFTAEEMSKRSLSVKKAPRKSLDPIYANIPVRRAFTPRDRSARVIEPSEWLNNGNITYRIYLDDEIVADYLKARCFTDYSTKTAGSHTYRVMAWSEAIDEEFDAAYVDVDIEEVIFAAPVNLAASWEQQDNGKYVIQTNWDAPEGTAEPAYYLVYVNGKSIAWVEPDGELSAGQSGLYKGVYTFEVEACYEFPTGVSERVAATIYPGTVPAPENLTAKPYGNGVTLKWTAAEVEGFDPIGYSVYRGDELLKENLAATEFTDDEAPAGTYYYNVHALYADGEVSLPASVLYEGDECGAEALPFAENFDNGHLPAGWNVVLVDPNERVKDMYAWRFDNWFDAEIPAGSGLEGGFASANSVAAAMNRLETYLCTPFISLPEDSEEAVLTFTKYFEEDVPGPSGPASFTLSVSNDGDYWVDLLDLREVENGEVKVSLDQYAGEDIMIRWGLLGRNSGFAAVDNVVVKSSLAGVESIMAGKDNVDIISIDGKVIAADVTHDALKTLPSGIYLLRRKNGKTAKYIAR